MAEYDAARGIPAIEARGIAKAFDGRPANVDVDFRAYAGEVHAVLGENGAGKSTLISMLSGAYRPDSGEILLSGRKVHWHSPGEALRAGIGVVYQEFRLVENLSVLENVLLGTARRPSRGERVRIGRLAAAAGFDLPLGAGVRHLAIGARQQVEILKLLARELAVLIFDEPTAVLGEAQVAELFSALRMLRGQGKTIVLITHRLREVRMIADRLTILREGRVKVLDERPERFTDAELAEIMVGGGVPLAHGEDRGASLPARPPILALHEVHVPAPSGSGLRGVSLEVRPGEVVGVAGVRGNGQREIAEVAAGLLRPQRGLVERIFAEVGFIPEDRLGMGLSRHMQVAENLALRCYRRAPVGRAFRLDRAALGRFARKLIARYAIPARPEWQVTRLSGGGLQRVVVARELARETALIVAAQPTRGLDIRSAEFVRGKLLEAAADGAGVLLVSEDLDELMALAARIFVLYEGRVAAVVPRAEFDRRRLGAIMFGAGNRSGAPEAGLAP